MSYNIEDNFVMHTKKELNHMRLAGIPLHIFQNSLEFGLGSEFLESQFGQLCSYNKEKYILTKIEEKFILIFISPPSDFGNFFNTFTSRFFYEKGLLSILENKRDGEELYFDANVFPGKKYYQVICAWNGKKPVYIAEPYDGTYTFLYRMNRVSVEILSFERGYGKIGFVDNNLRYCPFTLENFFIDARYHASPREICDVLRYRNHFYADIYKLIGGSKENESIRYLCASVYFHMSPRDSFLPLKLQYNILYNILPNDISCEYLGLFLDFDCCIQQGTPQNIIKFFWNDRKIYRPCNSDIIYKYGKKCIITGECRAKAHISGQRDRQGHIIWNVILVKVITGGQILESGSVSELHAEIRADSNKSHIIKKPPMLENNVSKCSNSSLNNGFSNLHIGKFKDSSSESIISFSKEKNAFSNRESIIFTKTETQHSNKKEDHSNKNKTCPVIKENTLICENKTNLSEKNKSIKKENLFLNEENTVFSEKNKTQYIKKENQALNEAQGPMSSTQKKSPKNSSPAQGNVEAKRSPSRTKLTENVNEKFSLVELYTMYQNSSAKSKKSRRSLPSVLRNWPGTLNRSNGKFVLTAKSQSEEIKTYLSVKHGFVYHDNKALALTDPSFPDELSIKFDAFYEQSKYSILIMWVGIKPVLAVPSENSMYFYDVFGTYLGLKKGKIHLLCLSEAGEESIQCIATTRIVDENGLKQIASLSVGANVLVHLKQDVEKEQQIWKVPLIIELTEEVRKKLIPASPDTLTNKLIADDGVSQEMSICEQQMSEILDNNPKFEENFDVIKGSIEAIGSHVAHLNYKFNGNDHMMVIPTEVIMDRSEEVEECEKENNLEKIPYIIAFKTNDPYSKPHDPIVGWLKREISKPYILKNFQHQKVGQNVVRLVSNDNRESYYAFVEKKIVPIKVSKLNEKSSKQPVYLVKDIDKLIDGTPVTKKILLVTHSWILALMAMKLHSLVLNENIDENSIEPKKDLISELDNKLISLSSPPIPIPAKIIFIREKYGYLMRKDEDRKIIFSHTQCFLYGVHLRDVDLRKIIPQDLDVEVVDKSSTSVSKVFIGDIEKKGLESYEKIINWLCKLNVQDDIASLVMERFDEIPDNDEEEKVN